MPEPRRVNRLQRRGTTCDTRTYHPIPELSVGSSDGRDELLITSVGLEARRRGQIEEVIEQLAADGHALPPPFSKPELYRAAASVGIPVWEPEVKNRFTGGILDRLNYEWDPVAQGFVPVVGETLIGTIKTAAETVVPALNSELSQSLRRRLEDWCELHGFESLEHTAVQTIIARQALLSVLLQAALYERQRKQHAWPQLDTNPQTTLRQIEERTGHPGFKACVLDDVVQLFEATDLEAVLSERHRVLYSSQPAESIGKLYEALLPSEYRRTIGQHRTPPEIGSLMQTWATSGGDTVLDPGMGAGGLSTPFHPRWDVSTDPRDVTGIDRSPIAARMGITAQTLARQGTTAQLTDFLDLAPGDLDHDVDAVVCNPPYTRYQELPAEYRAERNAQAEDQTGVEIPGTSPLYAYFLYHLRQFLDPGDQAAVIVPHAFLARDYGTPLKRFLLREFHVKALLMSDPNTESVFENAQTTELILFLEARSEDEDTDVTRFIHVDEKQDVPSLTDAVRNGRQGETEWESCTALNRRTWLPIRSGIACSTRLTSKHLLVSRRSRNSRTFAAGYRRARTISFASHRRPSTHGESSSDSSNEWFRSRSTSRGTMFVQTTGNITVITTGLPGCYTIPIPSRECLQRPTMRRLAARSGVKLQQRKNPRSR